MKRETYNSLISITTLIMAILMIDWYWLFEDYWWRWFGLIGFGIMGWCWKK